MTDTDPLDATTEDQTDEQRPPLFSIECFTMTDIWGHPLAAVVWFSVALNSDRLTAVFLVVLACWVLVDLVVYKIRRGAWPPRPRWGKYNRWTTPLVFGAAVFSTVRAF